MRNEVGLWYVEVVEFESSMSTEPHHETASPLGAIVCIDSTGKVPCYHVHPNQC